jgi:carotenoid cleavage dioxygenase-like enzyme
MSRAFPSHPFLRGAWEPWPMEGEIHDVIVEGEVPRDLNGTLFRNGPNPQFPPRSSYHPFLGDGMIHAFRIEDGRVHYRNRWVRTPRFLAEREAGESLFGSFEDMSRDPRGEGVPNGPSNTNVVWHGGRLLALVEGGLPPVELDPETLETRRIWDFDGGIRRPIDPRLAETLGIDSADGRTDGTFTAHPKLDPESGEMLAFGYSAIPPYLIYYVISPRGELVRAEEIDIPFPAMIHDFVVTREHVVFPIFPATLRPERLAEGKSVIGWEPELGTHVGVMPREGGNADVVWLRTDARFVFHPLNAYTEGRRVIADMAEYPYLPIPAEGLDHTLEDDFARARLTRWTLDLDAGTLKPEPSDERAIEFPRLDERFAGLPYRHGYAASGDDFATGFDRVVRYDVDTGRCRAHRLEPGDAAGEPVFVPRAADAREGEGYLLVPVYRGGTGRSDLLILDAENVEAAPLAVARLPHRVPAGFHGNWRAAA